MYCQTGEMHWLTLKPGNYEVVGQSKGCGTPGCCLPDWHNGPHSLEKVTCRSEPKRAVVIRRSPRFLSTPFPWQSLDLDLQATVLLQLSIHTCELLTHFARLARVLRPMRASILRAMQLDEGITDRLSSTFTSSDHRLGVEPSALQGAFWGVHHASSHVEEQIRVELRLLRPRLTPRSWKWMLQIRLGTSTPGGDAVRSVTMQLFYTPSERLGQLRQGGRARGHTFCEVRRCVSAEGEEALRRHGVFLGDALIYAKLTTVAKDVVHLSSLGTPVFTWTLPGDVASVLQVVRAFV